MLSATKAFVLRTIKFGDTSLIVRVFTSEYGIVSLMVKGVRSRKAGHKAVLLQPLSFLDLNLYYKEDKDLMTPKEYSARFYYKSIPFNITKMSIAQFLLEVIEQCLKTQGESLEVYEFLENRFKHLDELKAGYNTFHLHFMVEFMQLMGITPQNNYSADTPYFQIDEAGFSSKALTSTFHCDSEVSALLSRFLAADDIPETNRRQRRELTRVILNYYTFHVSSFKTIKSLEILEMVFS